MNSTTSVLIGSNGAGKSNFVTFFRLLRELIEQRLQLFLATEGGADAGLYLGPHETREMKVSLRFGVNGYEFSLVPTADGKMAFAEEKTHYSGQITRGQPVSRNCGSGHFEARLKNVKDQHGLTASKGVPHYVYEAISSWVVYHFTTLARLPGFDDQVESTITKYCGQTQRTWRHYSYASSKQILKTTIRFAML